MSKYAVLKSRLESGDVIILDGAIGTELQAMGVPMDPPLGVVLPTIRIRLRSAKCTSATYERERK